MVAQEREQGWGLNFDLVNLVRTPTFRMHVLYMHMHMHINMHMHTIITITTHTPNHHFRSSPANRPAQVRVVD